VFDRSLGAAREAIQVYRGAKEVGRRTCLAELSDSHRQIGLKQGLAQARGGVFKKKKRTRKTCFPASLTGGRPLIWRALSHAADPLYGPKAAAK